MSQDHLPLIRIQASLTLKEEGQSQMFPSSGQTPEGMCNRFLFVAIPK